MKVRKYDRSEQYKINPAYRKRLDLRLLWKKNGIDSRAYLKFVSKYVDVLEFKIVSLYTKKNEIIYVDKDWKSPVYLDEKNKVVQGVKLNKTIPENLFTIYWSKKKKYFGILLENKYGVWKFRIPIKKINPIKYVKRW